MKKESNEAHREELNRLGKLWYEADPEEKLRIAEEIFCLAYKLFNYEVKELEYLYGKKNLPKYSDVIDLFFIYDWHSFDPNIKSLYVYMKERLKCRLQDSVHKDRGDHRTKDAEDPEKRKTVSDVYYDNPIDEDGEETMLDLYGDEHLSGDMLENLLYDEGLVQYVNLTLAFPERLRGRANNEAKINYYRMFFTDDVVKILQHSDDQAPFEAHEKELFGGALKTAFLDYFMAKRCRRVRELQFCPLKPYGEMVEGRPMEEPRQPLPNDVYITYLNTMENRNIKSDGTISNQRAEYEDFVRKNLCLPGTD